MSALETFTKSYIQTALWATPDNHGIPLEDNYTEADIEPATLEKMQQDCLWFFHKNKQYFQDHGRSYQNDPYGYAGMDFWLTRNRHGAGFWDGGWHDDVGNILTRAAHAFGEYNLCISKEGKIYGIGG